MNAIVVAGMTVYAGGNFTTIGGAGRNRIAALSTASGTATTWNPDASATVKTLLLSNTKLYVGGAFTTIGGSARNRVAALDTTLATNNATSWNPNANNQVLAMALSGMLG